MKFKSFVISSSLLSSLVLSAPVTHDDNPPTLASLGQKLKQLGKNARDDAAQAVDDKLAGARNSVVGAVNGARNTAGNIKTDIKKGAAAVEQDTKKKIAAANKKINAVEEGAKKKVSGAANGALVKADQILDSANSNVKP